MAWLARAGVGNENSLPAHGIEEERAVGVGLEGEGAVKTVIFFFSF